MHSTIVLSRLSLYRWLITSLVFLVVVALIPLSAGAQPYIPLPMQPGFEGGRVLSGAAIEYASPATADLDKDGKQEIIIGGIDGKIHALRSDGSVLWVFDATASINAMAPRPGGSRIDSAPAVADLDWDGWPEVVVAVGAPASVLGYNGGIVVLDHLGRLRPGWPRVGSDQMGPNMGGPDGYLEGFYSSPAIGDLDGDGDLEIVAGGWDMRVYAWHHDGSLVQGWPRFVYNTVWSSPAIADLDNDGCAEVIIGVDASDGGLLEVLQGDGSRQPGFPKHIDQTISSSPAIVDLNGDGNLDIVVGTGNYYPDRGKAVYAWDAHGNNLPGWPAATGGYVMSSPAIGDINADGRPDVVVGADDGKLYAFGSNGQLLPGWPAAVYDNFGNVSPVYHASPVLANFDDDSASEIFINYYCDTVVFDGDGKLLTHVGNSGSSGKPSMYMFNAWCLGNTPVVQDLDADGYLEVVRGGAVYDSSTKVIGNALIYAWEVRKSPATAEWPMFRRSADHRAIYSAAKAYDARPVNHTLPDVMAEGELKTVRMTMANSGTQAWTAAAGIHLAAASDNTLAPGMRVSLASGESVAPGQQKTFEFQIQAPSTVGYQVSSWRIADGSGRFTGSSVWKQVKIGDEPSYYVLSRASSDGVGGVYAGGLASQLSLPRDYWNWPEVRGLVLTSDEQGYEMLDSQGGTWQGGTAPAPGGHGFVPGAVELLMRDDQSTIYYILDSQGHLVKSDGALDISPAPPTFGSPVVRSGALTQDGKGVYLLLGDGIIHTGGNAPGLEGTPYFGEDIAKKIELAPTGKGAYILDAYGRVWNVGGAPAINWNYALHMGEDWARDFEITEDGKGFYLLDREGGVHTGGVARAPSQHLTPVWPGQDVAVALALADGRIAKKLVIAPTAANILLTRDMTGSIAAQVQTSDLGSASWRASPDAGWLNVQPATGAAPGKFSMTIAAGQLALGTHSAKVTITDTTGNYPARSVEVQVRVVRQLYKSLLPSIMR